MGFILLIAASIVTILLCGSFGDEPCVKIAAITCSGVVCAVAIICYTACILSENAHSRDLLADEEMRELYQKIGRAFAHEPKFIKCRCNKISESIVNVWVHKK